MFQRYHWFPLSTTNDNLRQSRRPSYVNFPPGGLISQSVQKIADFKTKNYKIKRAHESISKSTQNSAYLRNVNLSFCSSIISQNFRATKLKNFPFLCLKTTEKPTTDQCWHPKRPKTNIFHAYQRQTAIVHPKPSPTTIYS